MAGVEAAGYITPTPIQKQAIPPVMEGQDVMGLAQTGTGKTAAFVLPILERLLSGPRGKVRALIIAPTRELAEQINDTIIELGRKTGLRSTTVYGGVGMNPQIQKLRARRRDRRRLSGPPARPPEPEHADLSHLEVLVLDEADRMFDMGFLPDIRRILKYVPAKRQTLLFSATMPDDIRHLAHEILHNPVTVQVGHTAPANTVSHALYPVPQHLKTALLLELLAPHRHGVRADLHAHQAPRQAHRAAAGEGRLQGRVAAGQPVAEQAAGGARRLPHGTYQILVATDIAARGIDVSTISHVINYDMPDTVDAYTHRIGRTGRAAKTGDAFTFVTHEDEPLIRSIERVLGEKIERRTVMDFDYKKAAPARDAEFARPPREPQRRRTPAPARPEQGRQRAAAPGPRGQQASVGYSGGRTAIASPQRTPSGRPRTGNAPGGTSSRRSWGARPNRGSDRGPGSGSR